MKQELENVYRNRTVVRWWVSSQLPADGEERVWGCVWILILRLALCVAINHLLWTLSTGFFFSKKRTIDAISSILTKLKAVINVRYLAQYLEGVQHSWTGAGIVSVIIIEGYSKVFSSETRRKKCIKVLKSVDIKNFIAYEQINWWILGLLIKDEDQDFYRDQSICSDSGLLASVFLHNLISDHRAKEDKINIDWLIGFT